MSNSAIQASNVAIAVGAVFACVVVVFLSKIGGRLRALIATKAGRSPFAARPVMNRGEGELYAKLVQAVPTGCLVLAQVQLSGFMSVRGLENKKERWAYLNRIIRLSIDFLVVDKATMMPLLGIELDGASHEGIKSFATGQLDADARKSQAMKSANVPLLRIPVKRKVDMDELRSLVASALRPART